jgi:hypothetical protein
MLLIKISCIWAFPIYRIIYIYIKIIIVKSLIYIKRFLCTFNIIFEINTIHFVVIKYIIMIIFLLRTFNTIYLLNILNFLNIEWRLMREIRLFFMIFWCNWRISSYDSSRSLPCFFNWFISAFHNKHNFI